MKQRLEEIEQNMKSILQEVNKGKIKYENIEFFFWPARKELITITIWDGNHHANVIDGKPWDSWFKKSQFIAWVEREKILFQKFDHVL